MYTDWVLGHNKWLSALGIGENFTMHHIDLDFSGEYNKLKQIFFDSSNKAV